MAVLVSAAGHGIHMCAATETKEVATQTREAAPRMMREAATQTTEKELLICAYKHANKQAAQDILNAKTLSSADAQSVLDNLVSFTQRRKKRSIRAKQEQIAQSIERYIKDRRRAKHKEIENKRYQQEWHQKEKAKNRTEFQRKAVRIN